MNIELRTELNNLLSQENAKNWYVRDLFIKNTVNLLPAELELVHLPPKNYNYNCFIYVLNLYKNHDFLKKSKGFIYADFIEYLILKKILEKINIPIKNAIIFYKDENFLDEAFTHAGIYLSDNLVLSKWSWGPILKHKVFDVPLFYGDIVEYYKLNKGYNLFEIYNDYIKTVEKRK